MSGLNWFRKQFGDTKDTTEKGQVLLVVILLSTVLLTVGLSITELTAQDTQVARIQEDSSRARAAAEAGIEAAIGQSDSQDIDISSLLNNENFSGTATFDTSTSPQFTTPLISKDGQYTFYLHGYDTGSQSVLTGSLDSDIAINRVEPTASDYCSGNDAFAVEVTLIDTNASTAGPVQRYLIDECDMVDPDGAKTDQYSFGDTLPTSGISPDPDVLITRVIAPSSTFDGAKLRIDNVGAVDWPLQGRTVISTASVGDTEGQDVTKKIQLFQSFPQLPAEFFITTM